MIKDERSSKIWIHIKDTWHQLQDKPPCKQDAGAIGQHYGGDKHFGAATDKEVSHMLEQPDGDEWGQYLTVLAAFRVSPHSLLLSSRH